MATISDVQYSQNETVTNPCIHLNPPPWRQKLWRTRRRHWQRGRQRSEHKPRTSTELLGRNRLIFSFLICFSINLSITTVITPRDTCFFLPLGSQCFFWTFICLILLEYPHLWNPFAINSGWQAQTCETDYQCLVPQERDPDRGGEGGWGGGWGGQQWCGVRSRATSQMGSAFPDLVD